MNWKNELENESENKIKQHAHSHTHFIFFAQLRSKLSLQNRRNPNLAPHNLLKKKQALRLNPRDPNLLRVRNSVRPFAKQEGDQVSVPWVRDLYCGVKCN